MLIYDLTRILHVKDVARERPAGQTNICPIASRTKEWYKPRISRHLARCTLTTKMLYLYLQAALIYIWVFRVNLYSNW